MQANNLPQHLHRRPLALAYRNRLHHPREYRRFFGQSEVFRFTDCTVFRIPNGLGHFRLGITLKARGMSVERNRVKRRIREEFRKQALALGAYDYNVVISSGKKLSFPFPQRLALSLRKDLQSAFGQKGAR